MDSARSRVQTLRMSVIEDKNIAFELWEALDNLTEESDYRKEIGKFSRRLNPCYMTEEAIEMQDCIRKVCSGEITATEGSEMMQELHDRLSEAASMFADLFK